MRFKISQVASVAMFIAACGGTEPIPNEAPKVDLNVSAEPRGLEFVDEVEVSLTTTRPAAIFYTTDGSQPTEDRAEPYTGPIVLTSDTLLMFIARTAEGVWSRPVNELYMKSDKMPPPPTAPRLLSFSDHAMFFNARVGQQKPVINKAAIRSIGTETVTIRRIAITGNPEGGSFTDTSVFELIDAPDTVQLGPGESVEFEIAYTPTDTLRSAVVLIESDGARSNGIRYIELWGRSIAW